LRTRITVSNSSRRQFFASDAQIAVLLPSKSLRITNEVGKAR
jgi:hypothetical protein